MPRSGPCATLTRIAGLYTMASERAVHGGFLMPGMDPAPAITPTASDDDLFDDAFF